VNEEAVAYWRLLRQIKKIL